MRAQWTIMFLSNKTHTGWIYSHTFTSALFCVAVSKLVFHLKASYFLKCVCVQVRQKKRIFHHIPPPPVFFSSDCRMVSLSSERWLTWLSTMCRCRRYPATSESMYIFTVARSRTLNQLKCYCMVYHVCFPLHNYIMQHDLKTSVTFLKIFLFKALVFVN